VKAIENARPGIKQLDEVIMGGMKDGCLQENSLHWQGWKYET